MPKRTDIKSVMVIGSGPIVIGQAAEFDYSGTQACRVLREEGIRVILVNSNPATIMTDPEMADATYIEPIATPILEQIIAKERPDALLPTLGGQTALNAAMALGEAGVLEKYNVELIGASLEAIDRGEDRELFKKVVDEAGAESARSDIAHSLEEVDKIAEKFGYPLVVRPSFTMGGLGSGIAHNEEELHRIAGAGIHYSPTDEVLIEEGIEGWKEFELELMRDRNDNVVVVCPIENVDPVGVHTGDSITVAPVFTLTDREYQKLRDIGIAIIRGVGVDTGGCNIQFAVHPDTGRIIVIEMNPRVSRSSALASKATGFPIAKIATKLALGYTLDEIQNDITQSTPASFEPTIDYVVTKVPRFAFEKFQGTDDTLTTRMKAVGEIMSIGRTFEESLGKALRSLENGRAGLGADGKGAESTMQGAEFDDMVCRPTANRIFFIGEAMRRGMSVEELHEKTGIDPWFLARMADMVAVEQALSGHKLEELDEDDMRFAKRFGLSDVQIAHLTGSDELSVRAHRKALGVVPAFKTVDTCAGEFPARTSYHYKTYEGQGASEFREAEKPRAIILSAGPNRIGQGIEFDYCSVHCVWALKRAGFDTVIINNNPETVSTDFDTADRLYFEPLTPEDVMNVLEIEQPVGVVCQFGGQTAIKLAKTVREAGYSILGTDLGDIDAAEDRELFNELLNRLGIPQPKGTTVFTADEAAKAAAELGYPVLVRPSYVLGGQGMEIAYDEKHIREYMSIINMNVQEHPILVDKYLLGREIEVDAICDGENVLIPGIMEHVERAGIHSGDSISVYPPQHLAPRIQRMVTDYTINIARSLHVRGLVNIQFIEYAGDLYIIEVNPRSSRTVPYISKVTGIPIVELGVRASLGEKVPEMGFGTGLYPPAPTVAVKMPVFSFEKLPEVEVSLGPEMKSTGEALGLAETAEEAYLKGFASTKMAIPKPEEGGVLFSIADHDKREALELAETFAALGFEIYATTGTAHRLNHHYVGAQPVPRPGEDTDKLAKLFDSGKIRLIIATPTHGRDPMRAGFRLRRMAVEYGIACVTSIDTAKLLMKCVKLGKKAEDVPPLGLHDLIL